MPRALEQAAQMERERAAAALAAAEARGAATAQAAEVDRLVQQLADLRAALQQRPAPAAAA